MIEYFIKLMDLDADEEQRLIHKMRPMQRKIDAAKVWLAWLCIGCGIVWGFSNCGSWMKESDARRLEERHQTRENKCQIWANIHSIDVKWNRDMWLCMGKGKDGSVYTVVLESGRVKRLKGRD